MRTRILVLIVLSTAAGFLSAHADATPVKPSMAVYRQQMHDAYCPSAKPCTYCQAFAPGSATTPIGECPTTSTLGSSCRCASTAGWLKGFVTVY